MSRELIKQGTHKSWVQTGCSCKEETTPASVPKRGKLKGAKYYEGLIYTTHSAATTRGLGVNNKLSKRKVYWSSDG